LDEVSSFIIHLFPADAYRVARGFQLRIDMKTEPYRLSYEGFRREVSWFRGLRSFLLIEQNLDEIKKILDEFYGLKLEIRDVSLRGYNWGKAVVESESGVSEDIVGT
jgi:structure-specific recognition protein 1